MTWPVIISRWFRRNRGWPGACGNGSDLRLPLVIMNTQIEETYGWRVVLFGYGALILVGVTLLICWCATGPDPYGLRPDVGPVC